MELTATAPGKMILLGEYAVLEGAPAIVAAVNRYARITYRSHDAPGLEVEAKQIDDHPMKIHLSEAGQICFDTSVSQSTAEAMRFFSHTIETILRDGPSSCETLPAGSISLDTGEFYIRNTGEKLGLGSSAALVAGLVKVICHICRMPEQTYRELFSRAFKIHKLAQGGVGSGIDVAASVYGGVLRFQRIAGLIEPEVQVITLPESLHCAVVWSGVSASTPLLVESVQILHRDHPRRYNTIMTELERLSSAGIAALSLEDVAAFCDVANAYRLRLNDLGEISGTEIVSRPHQELAKIAREMGVAYKPSGAGGGDLGLAFSDDPQRLEALRRKWLEAGFHPLTIDISTSGAEINKNEVA